MKKDEINEVNGNHLKVNNMNDNKFNKVESEMNLGRRIELK